MHDVSERIDAIFTEHLAVAADARDQLAPAIAELAGQLQGALSSGGKLIVFGNGGSAADAQHFVAELVGRFRRERRPLAAIALTTDASVVSAIANDYSYDEVFARQVEALCRPGDVVVGISTSGDAASVVRGIAAARRLGALTWAWTGAPGGQLAEAAEHRLRAPSAVTARVQEVHVIAIHAVSELIDAWAAERAGNQTAPAAGDEVALAPRGSPS